ncbi:MAG: branched-chain amino acid ABC transporter permease [Opitutus sp.]|nr:branched-chain amino acid ABC transporter permease [Opitutus sp.]
MTEFLQQLLNGLSLGAVYALIALGYTMVYGVLRFINFAHSDVFMVGAFIGYYAGRLVPEGTIWGGIAVLLTAMVGCSLLGMRIEKTAYRPLREPIEFNLVTILAALIGGGAAFYLTRDVFPSDYAIALRIISCWAAAEAASWLARRTGLKIVLQRTRGGAPTLNVLITAIGVSLLLEYSGQLIFGAAPRTFPAIFPSLNFHVGGLTISTNQLCVIGVAAFLLVVLQFIVFRTRIGTAMRAVSMNPKAAALMGVNNDVVIAFTFALGSALAGAGGILYAVNYPSIDPLMGVMPGLKAFVAAILGGIGNIPGAALGGLLLGTVETFVAGSEWSTYKDAIAFAILIVILLFRPAGLLGRFTIEKV